MSYIGNIPATVAFLVDTFSGNGSTTAFTLSQAPANTSSILVAVSGVVQDPSTYSVSGTTLTFSGAPPSGTSNISVRFLGIPASGVATTAYRTVTEFTATSGQTTFSVPSYTVGYIDVYRNGVLLGSADYTATSGTTVVLNNGCTAGDLVETISFFVSSVLNAIPTTGGTFSGNVLFAGGNGVWNASGNVGVGTTSPSSRLDIQDNTNDTVAARIRNNSNGSIAYSTLWLGNDNTANAAAVFTTSSTNTNYGGNSSLNLYTPGATPITLVTNNLERMRVNSAGLITTPFQTAFVARAQSAQVLASSWQQINFDNNITQRGSSYNSANSRFTAPVSGWYQFNVAWTATDNSDTDGTVSLSINGSTSVLISSSSFSTTGPTHEGHAVSGCAFLNANDYVTVIRFSTVSTTTRGSIEYGGYFSGYLIG
jgi:hypothetical protein